MRLENVWVTWSVGADVLGFAVIGRARTSQGGASICQGSLRSWSTNPPRCVVFGVCDAML
eukprot:2087148-Rhodomonas_salina.2